MTNLFSLDFNYAQGQPQSEADFRIQPQDFIVNEILGFEPSGEGEHVVLSITKTSQNTHWVAQQLADFANIKPMDVGYCGRKDRHAVTTQWFSLYLPLAPTIDWNHFDITGVVINNITRHHQKLRPGHHQANHFDITLRNLRAEKNLSDRLESAEQGVPNYFGEQRFGREGGNLGEGDRWANKALRIKDKKQRGLIISALRSYLFNSVLSKRVANQSWQQLLEGDPGLEGEPSGPLWGRGRPKATDQVLEIENIVLAPLKTWSDALEHCGLAQERRQLVCRPQNFQYQFVDDIDTGKDKMLRLSFGLSAGQYATSVLREIALVRNQSEFTINPNR